jgi:hypothetical protein
MRIPDHQAPSAADSKSSATCGSPAETVSSEGWQGKLNHTRASSAHLASICPHGELREGLRGQRVLAGTEVSDLACRADIRTCINA